MIEEARYRQLAELARLCGVEAADPKLLNVALTHPTYVFENRQVAEEHNQRLEFLGDAVLGMLLAEYLYLVYPDKPEGELSKMRAAVACEATLARKAKELGLGRFLLLGRGEEISGGRERPSTLADAFEAVVAAIYLACGLAAARRFVWDQLSPELESTPYKDFKTELQELVQRRGESVIYRVLQEMGPDHNKRFQAGVFLKEKLLATGWGRSKKEAEQQAARGALERLRQEFPST
ncbi:MAG: ribonuclease III [Moorellales bacterium]